MIFFLLSLKDNIFLRKIYFLYILKKFVVFLFAEEDYDAFCLAYMFTYRDFEMGTLGLAWTGDLKNAGGVCEKNGVSSIIWLRKMTRRFFCRKLFLS